MLELDIGVGVIYASAARVIPDTYLTGMPKACDRRRDDEGDG